MATLPENKSRTNNNSTSTKVTPQGDLNVKLLCPDCRNPTPNIVEEFASGDLVCGDCGLVLTGKVIDTRSEWRTFANDDGDDPSRVGAASNPLLNGSQLDTVISKDDGGSGMARDLSKLQSRSTVVKGEKNLLAGYKEIQALGDKMGLTKLIVDVAKQYYKMVEDKKLLRGKSTESILAACIFLGCRQESVPRTFKEICVWTGVPKKELGRAFKALSKHVDGVQPKTMSSEDLMSRFCSSLGLPIDVQKAAVDLTKIAKENGALAGKSPVSVAAACIYLVCHLFGHPKATKDVAHVAGVSDVTIKNAYKYLYHERVKLVSSSNWKNVGPIDSLPTP